MKRLALSLALITGISLAETTDNQLNEDMEDGFLDSTYDYPNIHTHKQLGLDDNTIWTGSSSYTNEATQTVSTSGVIDTLDQLDVINYGVDYYSNYDGTVTLKADFYDEAGLFLDNDGGTYTISTGAWNTLSDTYSDTDYIDDIYTITITIGGVSDRGGTDDIQLRDAYVTYDYSEIPLAEILEDTTLDELIMDLIDEGAEVEFIEDIIEDAIEIEDEEDEPESDTEDTTDDEPDDESSEESDEEESDEEIEEETDDEPGDKEESNESSDSSSSNDGSSTNANSSGSVSTSDALEVLELVKSVTDNTQSSIFNDTLDFSSYTSVSLAESIELEDNADWYQNQAFYESIGMTDSGIFVGYNKVKLKDGEWYGSDTKFY